MFPWMNKPEPSLRQRIHAVLRRGPVVGQAALGSELGMKTHTEFNELAAVLRSMLTPPLEIRETKRQIPGTGHEGPPVFEYVYEEL